jgi:hypothetical protein
MFQETPEILAVFVKFQDLKTGEDQRQSEELQKHATLVMTALDTAISSIDDADEFISFLETTGRFHRKIPGFKKDFFWVSISLHAKNTSNEIFKSSMRREFVWEILLTRFQRHKIMFFQKITQFCRDLLTDLQLFIESESDCSLFSIVLTENREAIP